MKVLGSIKNKIFYFVFDMSNPTIEILVIDKIYNVTFNFL